jgi:hypothetical protein
VLAVGGIAHAGSINRREHRQIARITRGVQSGALTRRERLRLQHDLNRAGRDICRQTHDGQTR